MGELHIATILILYIYTSSPNCKFRLNQCQLSKQLIPLCLCYGFFSNLRFLTKKFGVPWDFPSLPSHNERALWPEVKSVQKELQKHGLGTEVPPRRFMQHFRFGTFFGGSFSIIRKWPVFSLFGNF